MSCNIQLLSMTPPCGDKTDLWVKKWIINNEQEGKAAQFFSILNWTNNLINTLNSLWSGVSWKLQHHSLISLFSQPWGYSVSNFFSQNCCKKDISFEMCSTSLFRKQHNIKPPFSHSPEIQSRGDEFEIDGHVFRAGHSADAGCWGKNEKGEEEKQRDRRERKGDEWGYSGGFMTPCLEHTAETDS